MKDAFINNLVNPLRDNIETYIYIHTYLHILTLIYNNISFKKVY